MQDKTELCSLDKLIGPASYKVTQKGSKLWLELILDYNAHPVLQFIKYGFVGGMATLIHAMLFTILNETFLPADLGQLAEQRGWNFFWSNTIAFCCANLVGYFANRKWVFRPGRHGRWKEFFLFYVVSILAFLLGTPLGGYLVATFTINEYFMYCIVVTISVFVNYFGRKYWIFHG